jgi:hypothetical protein
LRLAAAVGTGNDSLSLRWPHQTDSIEPYGICMMDFTAGRMRLEHWIAAFMPAPAVTAHQQEREIQAGKPAQPAKTP